jgi:hypothetical protein
MRPLTKPREDNPSRNYPLQPNVSLELNRLIDRNNITFFRKKEKKELEGFSQSTPTKKPALGRVGIWKCTCRDVQLKVPPI